MLSFNTLLLNGNISDLHAFYLYEKKNLSIGIFQNILYFPPKTDTSTSKNPKKGYLVRFFYQKTTHIPVVNADKYPVMEATLKIVQ
jgi:hypothetical protein